MTIINQNTDCNIPPPCTNGAANPPSCNLCPVGQYYNTTTSSCTTCPSGSSCPRGLSPQGKPVQPIVCVAGTYSGSGESSCTQCPNGTTSSTQATSISSCTDNVLPETTITSNPTNLSTLTVSNFIFTSNELNSTFECKIDNENFMSCTSPKTYTNLSLGSHAFQVRSIDISGNIDLTPAIYIWSITTTTLPVCSNGASSSSNCISCPAGQYYNTTSSNSFTACPSGTYSKESSTSCTLCPINTYCAATNTTTPTPCPTGKVVNKKGSKTLDECVSQTNTTVTPRTGGADILTIIVTTILAALIGICTNYYLNKKK